MFFKKLVGSKWFLGFFIIFLIFGAILLYKLISGKIDEANAKKDFYQVNLYRYGDTSTDVIKLRKGTAEYKEYERLFDQMIDQGKIKRNCKCGTGTSVDEIERIKNHNQAAPFSELNLISIEMLSDSKDYHMLFINGRDLYTSDDTIFVAYYTENHHGLDIYGNTDTTKLREYVESLFETN